MAYIEDSILAGEISALDPGDSWDGYTIVPVELEHGQGIKVVASTNRDILCRVAGMMIPFDSLTINTTENIQPVHGASRRFAGSPKIAVDSTAIYIASSL